MGVDNKRWYRVLIIATKVTPMLMAFISLINMILSYFDINDIPLNYIGGVSFLSLMILYINSYTLKLCEYHRMFLHYCVVVNVINTIDLYVGIPVNDLELLMIGLSVTVIMLFITLYLKIKNI